MLSLLLAIHVLLRRLFNKLFPATAPDSRLAQRVYFDAFFATIFLVGVHGFNTIKIFVILCLNYFLATHLGASRIMPVATWVFNVAILFLNEWYDGYRFGAIHSIGATLVTRLWDVC